MYHAIGTDIREDHLNLYNIVPEQFEQQVSILSSCKVYALNDLEKNGFVITFDDGYRDNLTTALPVLEKYQLPFTVFITTNHIDASDDYLSSGDIRILARHPLVTLGTHGVSHRRLTTCNDDELRYELNESKHILEALSGHGINMMSYPHGAVDARVVSAVRDAGYRYACCSKFGGYQYGDDKYLLKRTDIWSTDSIGDFKNKLAGCWDWMAWRT